MRVKAKDQKVFNIPSTGRMTYLDNESDGIPDMLWIARCLHGCKPVPQRLDISPKLLIEDSAGIADAFAAAYLNLAELDEGSGKGEHLGTFGFIETGLGHGTSKGSRRAKSNTNEIPMGGTR